MYTLSTRPLQLQKSNCNASLKLSCKYAPRKYTTNSATKWNDRMIDRTNQDSTLETYGDKSDVDQSLLKTIACKLQLFVGEQIKSFSSHRAN